MVYFLIADENGNKISSDQFNSKQVLIKYHWVFRYYSGRTVTKYVTIVNKAYATAHNTKSSYNSEGSNSVTEWSTDIQDAFNTSGASHTGGYIAIDSFLQ